MKALIKIPAWLPALLAGASLLLTSQAMAQTFTALHNFAPFKYTGVIDTNTDGVGPSQLLLSGNTLYGTASYGSINGDGTVFAVNTDGTGFTNLYIFSAAATNALGDYTNSDGITPYGELILAGNTLFGAANAGGTNGTGTLFAIGTNGLGFTVLHTFSAEAANALRVDTNRDGIGPNGLILAGNTLYGTAETGGTNGDGTLFAINTNGTGFTNLYTFSAKAANALGDSTNRDGANPSPPLILAGALLYGTAENGGTNGSGTVFAVYTNGAGFTTLHSFGVTGDTDIAVTNSDGATPLGLVLSGNTLYGVAYLDGTNGSGTVFALNTNGTAFTVLHTFGLYSYAQDELTNSDGINPFCTLVLSGNTLYGTTSYGGTNGTGTMFALSTNGTAFTLLHDFTAVSGSASTNGEGAHPEAGLILSGSTLYGTALDGGVGAAGTVFRLSFTPRLAIVHAGTNVVLTWPATMDGFDYTGYTLQSATNLAAPVTWAAASAAQLVGGQEVVTNSVTGPRKFYRLNQ